MERPGGEPGAGAGGRAVVARPGGAGGILDQGDAPARAEPSQRLDVGRHAALVDDDHRPGPVRQDRLDGATLRLPSSGSTSAKTGVAPT